MNVKHVQLKNFIAFTGNFEAYKYVAYICICGTG